MKTRGTDHKKVSKGERSLWRAGKGNHKEQGELTLESGTVLAGTRYKKQKIEEKTWNRWFTITLPWLRVYSLPDYRRVSKDMFTIEKTFKTHELKQIYTYYTHKKGKDFWCRCLLATHIPGFRSPLELFTQLPPYPVHCRHTEQIMQLLWYHLCLPAIKINWKHTLTTTYASIPCLLPSANA